MKSKNFIVSEIKIRYRPRRISNRPAITTSKDAADILHQLFKRDILAVQEQFIILYLDHSNNIIGAYCLSYGGITATVVDIRLILAVGLKSACTKLILAHNHPSGNLTASKADIDITKKIKEAGQIMDIQVLDHLIISPKGGYLSLADEGHL